MLQILPNFVYHRYQNIDILRVVNNHTAPSILFKASDTITLQAAYPKFYNFLSHSVLYYPLPVVSANKSHIEVCCCSYEPLSFSHFLCIWLEMLAVK